MGSLYENIMWLCNKKGIKGGKMCVEAGVSKGLLTDLKMGRRTGITAATAQKIADYFNVPIDFLLNADINDTGVAHSRRTLLEELKKNPDMPFSHRIDILVHCLNVPVDEIDSLLGTESGEVESWLRGFPPRPDSIPRLLAYFGLTRTELLNKAERKQYAGYLQCYSNDHIVSQNTDIPVEPKCNTIKIAGRDGSFKERTLTDDQLSALNAFLALMPDVPDDL